MKGSAVVFMGLLALASTTAEPVPAEVNETTPPPSATAANTTTSHGVSVNDYQYECRQPLGAVPKWYRLTKGDGPHECHIPPLNREWTMLNSYRDGGIQNVHWKYTDNVNDPECLNNWTYYAEDGRTPKTWVQGRTTMYGQNRRWCGLPVYSDGGVQGFQWDYCLCGLVKVPGRPSVPMIASEAPSPVRD